MTIPTTDMLDAWTGFAAGEWQNAVNTRDFIQKNYTPYEGDESFLAEVSESTSALWNQVLEGIKQESRTHAPVDFDTDLPSTITSHDAGYINKDLEKIVGLQNRTATQTCHYRQWRHSYGEKLVRSVRSRASTLP